MSTHTDSSTPVSTAADLTGQRVVVVGGGSRLGRSLALAAAASGAEIVVAGRSPEALADVLAQAGGRGSVLPIDLSDADSIVELGRQVGPFDHLISTVSMHASGPLADLSDEAIRQSIDAKVLGPLRLVRATAAQIRPGGSYTFFSGQAAWRPAPGSVVTSTVNGALAFLVQALAVELAPIRVNAIAPGLVDSGALDRLGADRKAEILEQAAQRNPVGRAGTADDIVPPTMMVLTNGYITGTVLHVDGGGPLA
jgi:NAD(P)-dependent dehydrogenase (short-subunit alcohol dehydrogenase family)